MNKLHIFLACADSETKPLSAVRAEYKAVSRIFENETSKVSSDLNLKNDLNFELESLVQSIRTFRDTLHLFHFAGHANGDVLLINDKATNGDSISQLLGQAPKLKLVFLNACATKGHVNSLFDKDIPIVIATSASIPDELANMFSQYFYEDFVTNNRSLIDSFNTAVKSVKASFPNADITTRDTNDSFFNANNDKVPWGLYINPKYDQEEIKGWTIGIHLPFSLAPSLNSARNPFIVGSFIQESDAFFNRHPFVSTLKDIKKRLVCIIGVRRIGKTSLLHQIANAYQKHQQRVPLLVKLHQGIDVPTMNRLLYRAIDKVLEDHQLPQGVFSDNRALNFLELLSEWGNFCEQNKIESVMLIDEADQLSLLGQEGLTKFSLIFASEYHCLSTIITGSRALRRLETLDASFLLQFEQKTLDVFPPKDTKILLTQRATLSVSDNNLAAIIRFGGNHPYLSQYIASKLYDEGRLLELSPDHEALVLRPDISDVLADEYRRLTDLEKQVMRLLQFEKGSSLDELNRRISKPRAILEATLLELKELSFVHNNQGLYTLGNIFWEKYLQTLTLEKEQEQPAPTSTEDINPSVMKKSIFISYHLDDTTIFQKLKIHLNPRLLDIFDSNSLVLGDGIADSLEAQINQTQTIILLLSATYLADEEKFQEREAIKALKAKGKKIIPILASACDWEEEFGGVVILPRDKKPIDEKANKDKELFEITKEIKKLF